ncbi:hypothetical protein LCGC14_1422420 [marine sediment metagenome]|uniref:Uncharacterized protein n=1 Tax=marine sediment metagenome TaxID=412755 RepID=A0A0F9M6F2_9ZZZZ|nr:hypothetical protein [bacterium]
MSEKKAKYPNEIFLRSYPKVLFFYPLLIFSLILGLIQALGSPNTEVSKILGYIWFIVFFINIFVTAFDFSSTKFFVLILAILIVVLLVIFLVLPRFTLDITNVELNLALSWEFYMVMTLILGFILGITVLSTRFEYYKIERNEIIHKSGIFSSAERFPVKSLRFKKSIPDVFEFFLLRAGSLILMPGKADEVMILPTVLNINKKEKQLDWLLSHVSVEPDEID